MSSASYDELEDDPRRLWGELERERIARTRLVGVVLRHADDLEAAADVLDGYELVRTARELRTAVAELRAAASDGSLGDPCVKNPVSTRHNSTGKP